MKFFKPNSEYLAYVYSLDNQNIWRKEDNVD
jgi:hypothetical protein